MSDRKVTLTDKPDKPSSDTRREAITLATGSSTVKRRQFQGRELKLKKDNPKLATRALTWDDLADPKVDKAQPLRGESLVARTVSAEEEDDQLENSNVEVEYDNVNDDDGGFTVDEDDLASLDDESDDPHNVDKLVVQAMLARQRGEEVVEINNKPYYKAPVVNPEERETRQNLKMQEAVEVLFDGPMKLTPIKDIKNKEPAFKPQGTQRREQNMAPRFEDLAARAAELSGRASQPGAIDLSAYNTAMSDGISASGLIENVRDWTSKFAYTAEQEYVRITRETPAVYAGYSAKGWLCDAYEPFDESYLASVWGGGTYRLTAFQGVDRSRPYSQGIVSINGVPKAYRGADGQPVPFPEVPNPSGLPGMQRPPSMNGMNGQNGHMNGGYQPRFSNGMDGSPGGVFAPNGISQTIQTPNGLMPNPFMAGFTPPPIPTPGTSLADTLSIARQAVAESESKRENNAALEVMRDMSARSHGDQAKVLEIISQSSAKLLEPLERTVESYKVTLDETRRQHSVELESIRGQYARDLESMHRQHQANLDRVREDFKAQNEAMRLQNQQIIESTRNDAIAREQSARSQYEFNLSAISRELDNLRTSRSSEIESIRSQLTSEANSRESRATETARMFYETQIQSLRDQLRSVENISATRIGDIKDSGNNQLQMTQIMQTNMVSVKDSEIARLAAELASLKTENKELRDKSDPMQAITGAMAFKRQMDELTGNVPAPSEPEPTSILGMLGKYGPAINQNLIAPVMDPVKKAIEAAKSDTEVKARLQAEQLRLRQEQLNQQRQAMQNQQFMNQQQMMAQQQQAASQQQQQQFRSAQLTQQPMMQQPVIIEQPQFVQPQFQQPMMQVMPQQVVAPQVVEAQPEQQEGDPETEKTLVEFLSNALNSNQPPASVVGQVATARTMGVIPESTYLALMEAPNEEIVSTIVASATKLGHHRLTSPRGIKFLNDILAQLKANPA